MSLEEKLKAIHNGAAGRLGTEITATMHRATEELRASGIIERALKAGAASPAFTLPNQDGVEVSSADLLRRGPLVLTFYRGVW